MRKLFLLISAFLFSAFTFSQMIINRDPQIEKMIKEVSKDTLQVVMIYRNDRFLRGGDHTAFVKRGYAVVRFTEMNENYYHQHLNYDFWDFLDYEEINNRNPKIFYDPNPGSVNYYHLLSINLSSVIYA